MVSQLLDAPLPLCTVGFAALLGGLCVAAPPLVLDVVNTMLVAAVVATFAVRLPCDSGAKRFFVGPYKHNAANHHRVLWRWWHPQWTSLPCLCQTGQRCHPRCR